MKKTVVLLLCLLLAAVTVTACGAQSAPEMTPEPSAAAEATPEPTPEPTPTPTPPPTEWTITDESAEEILALAELTSLEHIDATASSEYDALLQLREALPDCSIDWEYVFQGERLSSHTTALSVTDMSGLEDALRCLPELEEVDLLEAKATREDLDRFYEIRPDVFYLWVFRWGPYKVRTDIPVFSSLQPIGFVPHDENFYSTIIKYCTKLRALDLGHNRFGDISPIGRMKDLQILILADDHLTDASCLSNLHELTFLELFLDDELEDFSFLNEMPKLRDLNLCYCKHLTSLEFLDNMPELENLLVKYTGLDSEYYNSWKEKRPEVRMVLWDGDIESTGSGWRDGLRNHQIRFTFSNWPFVTRYGDYDDVDFEFYGVTYPLSYYVK